MIKNSVYQIYFASCMNIIFNEQKEQNKFDTRYFLSHIIFIANLF